MPRSVPEWIGKNDDSVPPPRVRLRVFERFGKACGKCSLPLTGKRWTCDHKIALINQGENRESNLWPLGDDCCNPAKNRADVAEKSATYRTKLAHSGIRKRPKGRGWPHGRDSKTKRKVDGAVVDRRTGRVIMRGRP